MFENSIRFNFRFSAPKIRVEMKIFEKYFLFDIKIERRHFYVNFKRCERDRPEGTYKYRHIEFDSIICESASTRPLRPVIKTGIFADISEKHSILRHQPNPNERNF